MAVIWSQPTWPGANGADVTTITPVVGGSYGNPEGSLKADGGGYLFRNLSSTLEGLLPFTGFAEPASRMTVFKFDVWSYLNYVNQLIELIIQLDSNNKYQIRVTNKDANNVAIDVYRTVAGSLVNIGLATNLALVSSSTAANSTANMMVTFDRSTIGAPTLKVEAGVNGGVKSTIFNFTSESNSIAPTTVNMGIFQTNGGGTMRLGPVTFSSLGGVMTASQDLGDMVFTGAASATCMTDSPQGGSGSYTYQWYRDVVANFTAGAGNLLAGQTSQMYNKSDHVANLFYYLRATLSDGSTTITTTTRRFSLAGLPKITIGIIGDSTFNVADGNNPPTSNSDNSAYYLKLALATMNGLRGVAIDNQAVSGSSTSAWQSGGTNMNTALGSFASSHPDYVIVCLGVNDGIAGVSASTFDTQYANIVSTLTGASYKPILSHPGPANAGNDAESHGTIFTDAYYASIDSYLPKINAYVNGTTIFAGDRQTLNAIGSFSAELGDNNTSFPGFVHYKHQGCVVHAFNTAMAINKVINPAAAAGLLQAVGFGGGFNG